MKVTVCFGSVRVLVPCGSGDLLVRDLVREATLRYKKATGQGPETWIGVRALRASSGGILDPDDRVCDVADDRETLTAECTTQSHPRATQADGASGSSAGTASPDVFRGGGGVGGSMRVPNTDSCVEVGEADLEDGGNGLQVRRGSEPTLHKDTLPPQTQISENTKRWSAAVVCREEHCNRVTQKVHPLSDGRPPESPPDRLAPPSQNFQRQSNRLSMQFTGPGSSVWLDAVERVQSYGSKSLPRDARKEPLGQDTNIHNQQNHRVEDMLRWVSGVSNVLPVQERPLDLLPEVGSSERAISDMDVPVSPSSKPVTGPVQSISVTLVKGEKGLGFTITTRDNPTGGHCPIYIKNILPKGAAVSDGRLRAGDRLVAVNGISVSGLTQQQVVTLLRNTPTESTVDIVVERNAPYRTQRVEPQPTSQYVEKAIGPPNNLTVKPLETDKPTENGRVSNIVSAINQSNHNDNSKRKLHKSSSKDDLLNRNNSMDDALQDVLNSSSNSILSLRNKLILRLDVPVYDSEKAGLGISVKGKVTVGPDPQDLGIFIKSVLNGGAASRDGRLHTNDQLLSVNGVSLVGQSNVEAMETLRRALLHSRPHVQGNISLTIARRSDSMDSIARWKDDTPPSDNDVTNNNSTDHSNSNNFNTVIYNTTEKDNKSLEKERTYQERNLDYQDEKHSKKHASIITINNNNSWVSNQSDDNKGYLEKDLDSGPRNNKRDSFEWSRLDGWNPVIGRLTGLRNESYYMATQTEEPPMNGHNYRQNLHMHMSRSPPAHHNVIIEEDYGTSNRGSISGGGGGESSSESGGHGFSRDAIGRRSMSEKRHAAMDAKQTGTYKKIKEIRAVNALAGHSGEVGPSLGMRKSSSLESLQTAIQETQRSPRNEPIYARAHPPLKHWLTDDSNAPDVIVRGSPQQSSLSHKKSSFMKSLSTMFRIGKPHKKPENDIYGRSQPARSSEKSLSRESNIGRWAKLQENNAASQQQQQQQQKRPEVHHERQSSGGSRSERGSERERRHQAPPPAYRAPPHSRTASHTSNPGVENAWGNTGHYVNYEEIQQNLHARREKLSEVQIGQMRRQIHAQRTKVEEEKGRSRTDEYYSSQRSSREGRPQSNYYEYDSVPPRRPGKLSHYH